MPNLPRTPALSLKREGTPEGAGLRRKSPAKSNWPRAGRDSGPVWANGRPPRPSSDVSVRQREARSPEPRSLCERPASSPGKPAEAKLVAQGRGRRGEDGDVESLDVQSRGRSLADDVPVVPTTSIPSITVVPAALTDEIWEQRPQSQGSDEVSRLILSVPSSAETPTRPPRDLLEAARLDVRSPPQSVHSQAIQDTPPQPCDGHTSSAPPLPPLQWASTPTRSSFHHGNALCKVSSASVRSSSLQAPRIIRMLEIEPAQPRPSSIDPAHRHNQSVITVTEDDLNRCGTELDELQQCHENLVEQQRRRSEYEATLPAPSMQLSFKTAFRLRCTSRETNVRDPWRNIRHPERMRVPNDQDLILNQVWCGDQEPERQRNRLPPLNPGIDGEARRSRSHPSSGVRANSVSGVPQVAPVISESVFMFSPSNMQRCAGRYELLRNEEVNGFPIWKQRGGNRWLYCGRSSRWYVGGMKEKNLNFECSRGIARSPLVRGRVPMPYGFAGCWEVLVHGTWHEDVDIRFSSEEPELHSTMIKVTLESPEVVNEIPQEVIGKYETYGWWANGFPMWRQRAGMCWLFSSTDGRWSIGDQAASDGRGGGETYLRTVVVHRSTPPEKMTCSWEWPEQDVDDNIVAWHEVSDIKVSVFQEDEAGELNERPFYTSVN
eukprot:TRINITY_DN26664_c0_g1_i1.p1 TRINITY_DN26664_c0_g1~~TRINITY_DN26664_c0_g1_i1.p1  ORF type:complete len:695 (-),score=111.97 TRINITY_DN26664_c0_g1_i1:103-2088(-)